MVFSLRNLIKTFTKKKLFLFSPKFVWRFVNFFENEVEIFVWTEMWVEYGLLFFLLCYQNFSQKKQ